MPLPLGDQQWPPIQMAHAYTKMAEWAAWYSGEPDRLMAVYSLAPNLQASVPWWRFWTRAKAGQAGAQRALLHVPIAGDLAATSAALLFGEAPIIRVRAARTAANDQEQCPECQGPAPEGHLGPHMEPDPLTGLMGPTPKMPLAPKAKPESPEEKAEARLLQIVEEGGVYSRLIEAAESAAAIGGIYIYPVWDKDLRPFPLMAIAQSDMSVPEFKHGLLTAVTFHRTVQGEGNRVIRLVERHEVEGTGPNRKAVVLSGLYQGTENRLGTQLGLGVGDTLIGVPPPPPRVELPFPDLDVEYIPNIKPNRLWRAEHLGVADIQGSETLLDALDETYASWMRDIRLAKARILVPREYLRPDGDAATPSFDVDQEIYVGLDMEPGLTQDSRSMLAHQFAIRYNEHKETSRELIDHIVSNAGYAPSTLGHNHDARATGTGTALRISEHKTLLTLRRKSGWWRTAVANTLYRMMLIDKEVFGQQTPAIRPTVDLSDSIIDQPLELAQTALALFTAETASIESRVRIVHPDWSEGEVDAEVARIKDETAPAPKPALAGFGNPATDAASNGNLPTAGTPVGPAPNHAPPASPPQAKYEA